jgi:hypothetical protein
LFRGTIGTWIGRGSIFRFWQRLRIDPLRNLGVRFVGQSFETGAYHFFRGTFPNDPSGRFYKIASVGQLKAHYRELIGLEDLCGANAEAGFTEIGHEAAITVT